MDLLAGREGFAPDLPHSYEVSEASRRDCTPDSKAVAIQRPQSASSQKLSLGIINTPYPGSLMTGVGARCNGCCRVGPD
jgi:hypothetical protein